VLRNLRESDEKIGNILVVMSKFDEALATYRDAQSISKKLVAKDPNNVYWQRPQAWCPGEDRS
jgi:hypothetical protein